MSIKEHISIEKKINKIEEALKSEGFCVTFHNKHISDGTLDCFWHDDAGKYATIENDRYRVEVGVYGELKYRFVDESKGVDFVSQDPTDLWAYGICNDDELHKALESDNESFYIEIIDNNWIEMPIYDKEAGEYITDGFDSCAIIPDTNDILEAIDGGISEYIDGFLNSLENEKS